MPWEVSHLSSHSPGKSVYRSQKKSEQKEGRAVVWSVWMINLKWRLQNATDTFTGSGRESFVGAMDAILSCTGCCHLCITVQPNLCCWQLCSLPCSCPRNFFFSFFWCHHVANSWTLVLNQQHKNETLPVVDQQWQRTAFYCFCCLCEGPPSYLHLKHLLSQLKAWYHHQAQNLVELSPEWLGSLGVIKHAQIQ